MDHTGANQHGLLLDLTFPGDWITMDWDAAMEMVDSVRRDFYPERDRFIEHVGHLRHWVLYWRLFDAADEWTIIRQSFEKFRVSYTPETLNTLFLCYEAIYRVREGACHCAMVALWSRNPVLAPVALSRFQAALVTGDLAIPLNDQIYPLFTAVNNRPFIHFFVNIQARGSIADTRRDGRFSLANIVNTFFGGALHRNGPGANAHLYVNPA